jgi:hypothetical protein
VTRQHPENQQRGIDEWILGQRCRCGEHDRNRHRTRFGAALARREYILEHAAHLVPSRLQVRHDHADTRGSGLNPLERPLRGELDLGRNIGCRYQRRLHVCRRCCDHVDQQAQASPAVEQARHGRRHDIEAGAGDSRRRRPLHGMRPFRETRFVDGTERVALAQEVRAPGVQRTRFRHFECEQPIDRNAVVVQTAPATGSQARSVRRAEEIA